MLAKCMQKHSSNMFQAMTKCIPYLMDTPKTFPRGQEPLQKHQGRCFRTVWADCPGMIFCCNLVMLTCLAIWFHWVYRELVVHNTVVRYHSLPKMTSICQTCVSHVMNLSQCTGKSGELFSISPQIHPTAQRSTPSSYFLAPYRSSGARYHLRNNNWFNLSIAMHPYWYLLPSCNLMTVLAIRIGIFIHSCQTKICNLEMAGGTNQQISWFQILQDKRNYTFVYIIGKLNSILDA